MPIPIDVQSAIDELRSTNPAAGGMSDESVYKYLKRDNPTLMWNEVDSKIKKKTKADTSPTAMNAFQEWFDYGIDENSSDWMKASYTNSLTGLTEELVTGKARYDLRQGEPGGYNPNIFEDIGSMALSFLMPLDVLAMAAGGGVGGLAAKGLGVTTAKEAGKLGIKQSLKHALAEGAVKQAGTLAVYEGAMGGVQAGINDEDVMTGIGKGVVHGGILGGLAGLTGGGMSYANAHLLNKFTKAGKIATGASKEATKAMSLSEKQALLWTGVAGQIPAEASVFTAAEIGERIAHGDDVRWKDVATSFGRNLGLFAVTKAQHKLFSKSMEHYRLLEEAEKQKLGVDSEGKPKEASVQDSAAERLFEEAKEKRAQGDELGAIAAETAAIELNKQKRGVDEKYIKFKEDLDQSRNDTKTLIKDHESGITTESPERVQRLIKSVTEQIGTAEKLIEHATDPVNPMFEGLLESYKQHRDGLIKQRDVWAAEAIRTQGAKEKPVWLEKKILEEGEKLGVDLSGIERDSKGKMTKEGREKATTLLKVERGELVDIGRKKITPLTAEGEAVTEVLTTEEFRTKDWSTQATDSKMRKDVETRVKGTEKEKGLADVDAKVVADTGGFESGSKKSSKYNNSKNIVRHFIQNVFPMQLGKTVRKGAFVGNPSLKATHLNDFAKWLAGRDKEFKEVTNEDYQLYLSQNKSHVTELQQLREFLQTNQIASKKFNLTRDMTKAFAKKYLGVSPEGLTTDAHSIGKNTLTYVQPKTNQPITKYISNKLQGILTKLKKVVGIKAPDTNQHFLTADGRAISHDVLNTFVDNTFGVKGLKDRARLFRDSLTGWASEKFGSTSAEVEVLIQEVLGDKGNVNTINKAYVSKEAQKVEATKLVKRFIAEINKGGKKSKGKDFYSTKEIADGLKKIKGKKDVVLEIDGKKVSIDTMTAEGMARYLIETSPRLNEVVPSGIVKYQLESAASRLGITVGELKKQINHFKKLYPELDINLKKSLGKFQGENVLGRITGHLIEIAEGRAKADTIPHEVSHHVVDILRAFGDKRSKDLIRDGERMFKGEEKMIQSIGEYVSGAMKNKGMIGKVKNFLRKFWSHLKHKLGVHNKADVTRILGEKVVKGKLPEGTIKEFTTKFQKSKESPEAKKEIRKINKSIHKGFNESLDRRVKNADPEGYKKARIDIFRTEKFREPDVTVDEMRRYEEYLTSHPANYGNSRSSEPIARRIEEINEKYHINPDVAKANLELMGVKGGLYENASPKTLKAYESFVRTEYDAPTIRDMGLADHLELKTSEIGKTKHPWMYTYGRTIMPVWLVLRKFGGKAGERMSDRLLNHEWAEHVLFKGPGDQALHLIRKTLGRKGEKLIKLFDQERAERNYKEGNLTPEEARFYEKIYGDKVDTKSDEYRAHQVWKNAMKFYWDSIEKELLSHETPESAKSIRKELESKHVNGYMMRRQTSKALKYLHKDHHVITELVDKQVKKLARDKAREEAKTDIEAKILEERYTTDYLEGGSKEASELRSNARQEIYNVLRYGYGHAKFPHLIPRKGLLKEYVEITNDKGNLEKIKVYEDSASATAETYISRMSKHLANVRYFPEWTGVGSKYKINKGTRGDIVAIEEGSGIANYAQLAIERQLGFDKNLRATMASPIYKTGGALAAVSAAIGLSSPLSGLKNLAIGIPRAIGVHGFWRTMRGIKHSFDAQAWSEARAKGYLEYGAKTLELGGVGLEVLGKEFNMRQLFSFNQMTRTENLNRIISSHAGQLYFAEVSAKLRGEKGTFLMKTNKGRMKRLMEEVWHLSKEEISFIEKTKDFTTKEAMREHAKIINKVGHFSHVTTQGGTSTVLLPLWMSSKEAKPLTLFQRMAAATTIDIYRNFVKPIAEYGNFAPLARAAVAHSVSGSALYFVYKELFGKEPPVGSKLTQEDSFDKIMLNLWRSEFFGLAGEVIPGLNPYERELGVPIAQPVIIRNITEAAKEWAKWQADGQTLTQAVGNWTKKSVVALSQLETLWKTSKSPHYKEFMAMRSMVRKFKKEREMSMYSADGYVSRRQPYYHDLKHEMMFGSEEDVAKAYWTAVDFIVSDIEKKNPYTTPQQRYKDAKSALKSVISHYSPLNISDERKGTTKTVLNQFYEWLTPENRARAKKINKIYEYKHRDMLRIINKPKWRKKYYVYPYS